MTKNQRDKIKRINKVLDRKNAELRRYNMNKRKTPLLKSEIEMLQMILKEEVYPTQEYKLKLSNRLEILKRMWYKIKLKKCNSELNKEARQDTLGEGR